MARGGGGKGCGVTEPAATTPLRRGDNNLILIAGLFRPPALLGLSNGKATQNRSYAPCAAGCPKRKQSTKMSTRRQEQMEKNQFVLRMKFRFAFAFIWPRIGVQIKSSKICSAPYIYTHTHTLKCACVFYVPQPESGVCASVCLCTSPFT